MRRLYNISLTKCCLFIFLQERPTNETVFKQTHEPNGFYTFASHQHQHEGKTNVSVYEEDWTHEKWNKNLKKSQILHYLPW